MIELGKHQTLEVIRKADFGIYLGDDDEQILLPKRQVPENTEIGDRIDVFVYRDSEDRLIATVNEPMVVLGETAVLKVKEISKAGAFLDWGLEKDLFLPYKEQTVKIKEDDEFLVGVYIDKSDRLCATMKVYKYLTSDAPYKKDDEVEGTVYNYNPEYGAFIAIDNKYHGMISMKELHQKIVVGQHVSARVIKVREDGKLDLSLRKKAYLQMDEDALKIYEILEGMGGELPYTDKASPEIIRRDFAMSKNEFKRAIGRLLKEHKVIINENSINVTK